MKSLHQQRDSSPRPALTPRQQVEHMSSHNISFTYCSKSDAISFLSNNTYYFKLKAFNNNFQTDNEGNYSQLDFAYLQDLAALDYKLRLLILRLTGNIEHALRVRFNNIIMQNNLDSYEILKIYEKEASDFFAASGKQYHSTRTTNNSIYTQGMIEKYTKSQPIWLFWETCTLNELIHCYRSFLSNYGYADLTLTYLYGVRLLRNAASHHNCLLIPLPLRIKASNGLKASLPHLFETQKVPIPSILSTLRLSRTDPLIHDIACVLLTHINVVHSTAICQDTVRELQYMLQRMYRHIDWYRNPACGCSSLLTRLDAIHALCTATVEFYKDQFDNNLSDNQQLLLTQPYKIRVRHGHRKPRSKSAN